MAPDSWPTESVTLETLVPALIIAIAIMCDAGAALPLPKFTASLWQSLTSPFRNFVKLEDVEGPLEYDIAPPLWVSRTLIALGLMNSFGWFAYFVSAMELKNKVASFEATVACATWAYATVRVMMWPPQTPPYLLILFSIAHAITASVDFIIADHNAGSVLVLTLRLLSSVSYAIVAGTLPMRSIRPAKNVAQSTDIPSSALSCPEDSVNLWSWCTVSFVEPILALAEKRTLHGPDVWSLSPFFKHKNIFHKYLDHRSRYPSHSLLRFLLGSNSLDLSLDLILEMWGTIVGFVPSYALKIILSALEKPTPESVRTAYWWAFITFVAHLSFAQVDWFKNWHGRRCYERTRGQLFCCLHYKALRRQDISGQVSLDSEGVSKADLGRIVNLMQGDAYSVAQRFWDFSPIFSSPIRLAIALTFLYQILGWSALSGVVVILVAYILNYPLGKYNIYVTRASWKAKDKRMSIINELLQNIRFLKYYGWENHWARNACDSREAELGWRVKENIVATLIVFIWTWIPSAVALVSFLCYTLIAKEKLTVAKAFTSIALFSQVQEPMTALPGQFFAILHAYVSMQRIEAFLNEEEVPDWASSLAPFENISQTDLRPDSKIGFHEATFIWHTTTDPTSEARFRLGPLDVKFPKGVLTLVTGDTGSGKSALLAALLGEMSCISGRVSLYKRDNQVAFCAQNPWLEHATIRDNIIFGSRRGYDKERYESVLEACALGLDLEVLDAGDMTEIGERGITLSGGQRARVALARAMYSEATCILLDDPLAAVDMHTAQHIVNRCLHRFARGRTIILVTHHISLCLPIASCVVELSQGQIVRVISSQDLSSFGRNRSDPSAEIVQDDSSRSLTLDNGDDLPTGKQTPTMVPTTKGKLVEAEVRAEGRVPFRTYWTYIEASGVFPWVITFGLMLVIRFINIGNQVFLAKWGEAYNVLSLYPVSIVRYPWEDLPSPDLDVKPWLLIYLYISMAGAFSVLAYISLGYYTSLQASRYLFLRLLTRLVRAPSRFFDTTPIGRILNRFTTDINTIDGALQPSARAAISGILNFIASFTVIIIVIPTFTPFALVIAWLYIRLAPRYVKALRDLRRLESISLSPAFSGFDELLRGLAHVRAFAMESKYQDAFYRKVDTFQSFDHVYWIVNGWLRWRYDCLGSVVVYLTTLFALWNGVTNGSTAIVIVQAGIFAEASRQLVRVLAQLELDFNSIERVVEYLEVPQEKPPIIEDNRPPAYWPSSDGELVVENLIVKYAQELPAVLKDLSFIVKPSEKIGVVGRTGSGKSTLALSLLRMVEASSGRIIIDGIDIATIGLEDLRTRITIVSQDVSLFSGTIRTNLDPFGEHTDRECWDVLERCHLAKLLRPLSGEDITLDMPMSQTGSLSAGERQLLALSRAILRRTNIIIMDEATSQIDSHLDDQIQTTIREELSGAMVITIAHRLKTIIDYDRVLVLDDGRVVEFGEPKELLKNGVVLREMCQKSADWPIFAAIAGHVGEI